MNTTSESLVFVDVIKFVIKHFKLLTLVFVGSGILTYLVSLFIITPKYLSEAIIYPANVNPVSSEDPTEQAVQVLNSGDIQWKIIDSFDLINHYGFGGRENVNFDDLGKKYARHVSIERTQYSSISISVLDQDPQQAADMANAIVLLMNKKMSELKRSKFVEWADFSKRKYIEKLALVQVMEDELNRIKKENDILNFEEQSANLANKVTNVNDMENILKSKIAYYEGNTGLRFSSDSLRIAKIKLSGMEERKKSLNAYFSKMLDVGEKIVGLKQKLELERESLIEIKDKYEEAQANVDRKITYSFVITEAGKPTRPSYPKKLFITLISSFSTMMFVLLILILKDNFQRIKQHFN